MSEDEERVSKPRTDGDPVKPDRQSGPENAFDVWLHDRLHQMYDSVTQEPIPPELAALIEADRRKREKG
jgi:hypothetical protein